MGYPYNLYTMRNAVKEDFEHIKVVKVAFCRSKKELPTTWQITPGKEYSAIIGGVSDCSVSVIFFDNYGQTLNTIVPFSQIGDEIKVRPLMDEDAQALIMGKRIQDVIKYLYENVSVDYSFEGMRAWFEQFCPEEQVKAFDCYVGLGKTDDRKLFLESVIDNALIELACRAHWLFIPFHDPNPVIERLDAKPRKHANSVYPPHTYSVSIDTHSMGKHVFHVTLGYKKKEVNDNVE